MVGESYAWELILEWYTGGRRFESKYAGKDYVILAQPRILALNLLSASDWSLTCCGGLQSRPGIITLGASFGGVCVEGLELPRRLKYLNL